LTGDFRGSREDAAALLSEKFRDAVLRRLSDSAEGLFLSGGVDSALIAAALKAGGIDMPSFTVGFQGDGPTRAYHFRDGFERAEEIYGEFDLSDATAASLGRPPTNRVAVGPETLTRDFAAVVRSLDVPCMSISAPPLFFLTGDAACSIRVAHSGGGADELFAGYAHCDPAKYAGAPSVVDRYLELVQVFSPEELSRIGSPLAECAHDLRGRLPERIAEAADVGLGTLPFVLAAERLGPLAHNILQKNDRIGMRMPLEMRYPFLDNEVVALAETLPEEMLTADGEGKLIVKLAAERLGVPPEISRRKKIRLQAPYATYLADVGVAAFFENIIANPPEGPRLYDPKKTVEFLFGPGCDKVWRRPSKILLLATWNLFLKA
jgi:asparagine synthase (glutamine-hydrolysing)